jgi:hypothetical protein
MKNLLSENMLRFGTKNLSEAAQRELVLKSIMETIDTYGLHNEVNQNLTEASGLGNIEQLLVAQNDGEPLTQLFKSSASYTTNNSFAAYSSALGSKNSIIAIPKGTTWTATADGKLVTAPCVIVNKNDIKPLPGKDIMDRLQNGEFIAKLAAGQIDSVKGGKVVGFKATCGMTLHSSNVVATSTGEVSMLQFPSAYVNAMQQKIQSLRA